MWTEVYFSQSEDKVDKLVKILDNAKIITRVKCLDSEGNDRNKCFKVLVPGTELNEAQELMVESDLF